MIKKKMFCLITVFSIIFAISLTNIANVYATSTPIDTQPIVGHKYFIKNVNSGKYLNVNGNSSTSGTNVSIYSKDLKYPRGQVFTVLAKGNNRILKPDCSSGVLNVYDYDSNNGTNVNIYKKSGSKTQQWKFIRTGTQKFKIISMGNNKYDYTSYALNSTGTNNRSNVNLKTYSSINTNLKWQFIPVSERELFVASARKWNGGSSQANSCLAFVGKIHKNVFNSGHQGLCCAKKAGDRFIDSTSKTNIPLGATVYYGNKNIKCSCGNYAGHIGIYIGNNKMVHSSGGKVLISSINSVSNYRGWGWYANDVLTNNQK